MPESEVPLREGQIWWWPGSMLRGEIFVTLVEPASTRAWHDYTMWSYADTEWGSGVTHITDLRKNATLIYDPVADEPCPIDFTGVSPQCQVGLPPDNILAKAYEVTQGKRREDYGTPEENHGCTAEFWGTYYHTRGFSEAKRVTAIDVCMLNILQKISRIAAGGRVTEDTFVDIAGFAENAARIHKLDTEEAS